jgi:hypothetical protein
MKIYYFGCIHEAGHFLWEPPSHGARKEATTPWGRNPDGTLCPKRGEGGALLHHKDGWTAIAFVDYSVDTRPGSNSAFLAEGIFTFDEMKQLAAQHFPEVWQRFRNMIHLVVE